MTPELAVARAIQWQHDWHAWITDPSTGSDVTAAELAGRAANVIEDLALALTKQAAAPEHPDVTATREAGYPQLAAILAEQARHN